MFVSFSGWVLNMIKRIELCYFYFLINFFLRQCMKFSFIKLILICQSGWYFGAHFIHSFLWTTHINSFIDLGIFKYLLYRKVFNIHHFSLCLLFPVHFNSWYLGYVYLHATCVAFYINGFFVLHVHICHVSTAGSVPLTKLCLLV